MVSQSEKNTTNMQRIVSLPSRKNKERHRGSFMMRKQRENFTFALYSGVGRPKPCEEVERRSLKEILQNLLAFLQCMLGAECCQESPFYRLHGGSTGNRGEVGTNCKSGETSVVLSLSCMACQFQCIADHWT